MNNKVRRYAPVVVALASVSFPSSAVRAADQKADLACSLQAWGARNREVADGGSVTGILEPNGQRALEYALTVRNGGGPAAAFKVRFDYVMTISSTEHKESKPPAAFPALEAGKSYTTPRMKVTASGHASVRVTATVDSEGAVAESDEANNSCKIAVEVK